MNFKNLVRFALVLMVVLGCVAMPAFAAEPAAA